MVRTKKKNLIEKNETQEAQPAARRIKKRGPRSGLITWDQDFLRWLAEGVSAGAGELREGRRA